MSVGFSVGDFVTVLELVNKIRKEFAEAPSQFKAISDEVRSLSIVLQDVDVVLSQLEPDSQKKEDLEDITSSCANVLGELEKILDKYGELESKTKSVGKKVRRAWKRLKWEPEDVRELRNRISSNVILLNAFNGQFARDNTLKLVQCQDDQESRTVLDWLTPADYALQQSDCINRRQAGTGQWLIDSAEFKVWVENNKQTLFCPGIPGAGKTILTSIVVEELTDRFGNDKSIGIAYLYCNFRQQDEQKAEELLASLVKQLAQSRSSLPESVKSLYDKHKEKRTRPGFDEISRALQSVAAMYSRVIIVIDALDECQASDGSRARLLSEVFGLKAKYGANIFATSRFIPDIEERFEGSISLEIRASIEDVRTYLDNHMFRLPGFVGRSPELQEDIKSMITQSVQGMFLLAQLHLESLVGKRSAKAVRTALEKLPTGSEAYDRAYLDAMNRIEGQLADQEELAKQVLLWITCAKRPLTISELRYALAVEVGKPELDEANLSDIKDMVSVCAGLVTVDGSSNVIRLVHYTTQEYFKRTQTRWFPTAETDITRICVTYLSFSIFESGLCQADDDFEERLRINQLYEYAAHNWGYHARAASVEVEQLITQFLESEAKVASSYQAMRAFPGESQHVPRQMIGVYLAAYFGLKEVMIALLKNGHDQDSQDTDGRTPLSWAAARGHEAVVKLLLERNDVVADSKDNNGQTPLSWAAEEGHEVVVELLLERDDVVADLKDISGRTPLWWAAYKGQEAVVKLLLERGDVVANLKDNNDQTPLWWAARGGHDAVVKLLLERDDVVADSKDNDSQTPLWWAARRGHEAVVKLLLELDDVVADSKDNDGQTPLWWAARRGHEAVVKLLLERDDVVADSKDNNGWTPLWGAAHEGQEAVVKLLLERDDVVADSKDKDGRTPLCGAASRGHEAVVKLLLERDDVVADSKDNDGQTPLWWAAFRGHEAVVKLLLELDDVVADSKDNDSQTPLWGAAEGGHEAVVKLLLERDNVVADSKDKDGRTPLSWAACRGHEAVVKLLHERDDIVADSKDDDGQTPLWWAAFRGHEAVVKLLLERDDVVADSKDIRGRTPLWGAASEGHEAVAELLRSKNS